MYFKTTKTTTKAVYWPSKYRQGGRSLLTWMLLVITFASVVYGIVDVLWGLEFRPFFLMAVVAISIQWLLADVPISPQGAAILGGLFGVEYVLFKAGNLWEQAFTAMRSVGATAVESLVWLLKDLGALFAWLWQLLMAALNWIGEWNLDTQFISPGSPLWATPPEWSHVWNLFLTLWGHLATMLQQSWEWLKAVTAGEVILDPTSMMIVWGLVIWMLASWAGWTTRRRHQPLLGILPASCVLSFVISYTNAPPLSLFPLIFTSLILMAMANHRARELRWYSQATDFVGDLWNNLFLVVGGVSLVLVLLSTLAPAKPLYTEVADWIDEVFYKDKQRLGADMAESLGLETTTPPTKIVQVPAPGSEGLPGEHAVGPGPNLTRRLVMMVSTGDVMPMDRMPVIDPAYLDIDPPMFRWRSFTYDTYTGHGWVTTQTMAIDYEAGVPMTETTSMEHRRILRQTVRRTGDQGNIVHVAGELASVDEPYQAVMRPNDDLFGATSDARSYNAVGLLPVFTEKDLRSITDTTYPEWVTERYLQLPTEVPTRVLDLAQQLTLDLPTAYDRARAIEEYMRTFPYTLEVPAPPPDREVADYFLFDLQRGYCDYYATTMAVMARATGLPARVAMGYSGGIFDPMRAEYAVYETDSHAWVEIYFPGYGWIEFEPTAGEPAIERVAGTDEKVDIPTLPIPTRETAPVWEPPKKDREIPKLGIAAFIALGIIGVALLASVIESGFLLLWRDAGAMCTRLYHHLRKRAASLHVYLREGDTPYEFAESMANRLTDIAAEREVGEVLAPGSDEVRALVEGYVQTWYAPNSVGFAARRALVWVWWKLRWRLWLAWIWQGTSRKGKVSASYAQQR
ncbi:MAG: transglutaminase domain-containing protein [Anaerolineae bacterium]|nr:transglutaminase domain-containing protein [Anaerolineae bacterium]